MKIFTLASSKSLTLTLQVLIIAISASFSQCNKEESYPPMNKFATWQISHPALHIGRDTLDISTLSGWNDPLNIARGGGYLPAGWNPFGYYITDLGLEYLNFDGSLDSDVGRFLASLKSSRKKRNVLREQWLEIVRVSKTGQSMRILRRLDELIDFCLKAGFLD